MKAKSNLPVSRLDYGQFLLSSQINYTLTYFANHSEHFSHDALTRYLAHEAITPHLVWENVQRQIVLSARGLLIFDDVVLDKDHSTTMELVRRQWSGNAGAVIKGIGVVTCVYVNPQTNEHWLVDYRIYAPDEDHKTKLDHVADMLRHTITYKALPFTTVLMDTWYATRETMLLIEQLGKIYYCPLKDNRLVSLDPTTKAYYRVDSLLWSQAELRTGRWVHLRDFPKGHQVKLFRLTFSTERTEFLVTNERLQEGTPATQEVWAWRSKIEAFHRESKQLTGIEQCQCRRARRQRNHIGCAMLVWVRLKQIAVETRRTLYQVKHDLLDDYMRAQLKSPTVKMTLA